MLKEFLSDQVSVVDTSNLFSLLSMYSLTRQIIVYVWSQYDGGNIKQRTIGYCSHQNQEASLKIVGGVILQSNQQEADPTSIYITSVIVS